MHVGSTEYYGHHVLHGLRIQPMIKHKLLHNRLLYTLCLPRIITFPILFFSSERDEPFLSRREPPLRALPQNLYALVARRRAYPLGVHRVGD